MESLEKLAQDNMTGKNHSGSHPNTPAKYLTASTIIGDQVHNHVGEHLGKIKDIMLDINEGKIDYVIIEFGGFPQPMAEKIHRCAIGSNFIYGSQVFPTPVKAEMVTWLIIAPPTLL